MEIQFFHCSRQASVLPSKSVSFVRVPWSPVLDFRGKVVIISNINYCKNRKILKNIQKIVYLCNKGLAFQRFRDYYYPAEQVA